MTDEILRHNSQSYVIGKQDPFLPMGRIGDALRQAANNWPHFEALVSVEQGIRLTWSGLDHAVDDLAAGLRALGLCPGDRVGLWAVNSAEWVIVQLATARVGMILVTINPAYRVEEFKHAVAASGCAALLVGPAYKTSNFAELTLESEPNLGSVSQQTILPTVRVAIQFGSEVTAGFLDWDEVIAAGKRNIDMLHDNERATFNELSPVNIQFTSGTTGLPKGVTLSHQNILQNGWFTGRALGLTERDRLCIPVPLYHCFGMVTGVLACVARGATMVLPSPTFDAERTLSTLAEEACTAVYGVPTMYAAILRLPNFDSYEIQSLRTGIMAGSICPEDLMLDVMTRMHVSDLAICYGMTEAPVSFQTSPADTIAERTGTVGRIQPNVEAKIISESGDTVQCGVTGEICVRGYNVMVGYWGDPASTATTKDSEGWLRTGDLGTIDASGFLNIVGRIKDMVIRGGENLYPKEIEEYLRTHSEIMDVHVFGVADAHYGEELCAWVSVTSTSTLTEGDLKFFCHGKISHNKIPKYVRFVETFPMTVTGKVQKHIMRAEMESRLAQP